MNKLIKVIIFIVNVIHYTTVFGNADGIAEKHLCRNTMKMKFNTELPPVERRNQLDLCNKFRKNTCCNETNVGQLKRQIHETRVAEFNEKCRDITEVILCYPCYPLVGTGEMSRICPELCDQWYSSCQNEYYSSSMDRVLRPCYGDALICSQLKTIVDNGESFCKRMGYTYGLEADIHGIDCFDGSAAKTSGIPEFTETLLETLLRMFDEQSQDPSGLATIAVMLAVVIVLGTSRILKLFSNGKSIGGHTVSGYNMGIEEARQRQQASYQALVASIKDEDTTSDEENDQKGFEALLGSISDSENEAEI